MHEKTLEEKITSLFKQSYEQKITNFLKKPLQILLTLLEELNKKNEKALVRVLDEAKKNNENLVKEIKNIKQQEIIIPKLLPAKVNVQPPVVNVSPAKIIVKERDLPNLITVRGFADFTKELIISLKDKFSFKDINKENPLPVVLTHDEEFYKASLNVLGGGGGGGLSTADSTVLESIATKQDSIINLLNGNDAVGDSIVTVTTAGTRVQLSDVSCKRVFIQALDNNNGTVVIGGSTVVAEQATRRGLALFASQGEWFNVTNLNLLYIDSTNSGDKITIYYEN